MTLSFPRALLARGLDAAPALIEAGATTSYRELRARVRELAGALSAAGLARGDRVALVGETSAWIVAAYLAAMVAGGVAVPLPPALAASKLESLLSRAGARFALSARSCADTVRVAASAGSLERLWIEPVAAEPAEAVAVGVTGERGRPAPIAADLAAILFTSGSTGVPRGVMVSHANLLANTDAIALALALGARDRALLVLPWHYCFGASVIHTHLRVGGSVAIGPQLGYAERVLDTLESTHATGLYGVPSTFLHLLARSSLAERELSGLRYVAQAGGRLSEPALRALTRLRGKPEVYLMYGQTEATARLSVLPPARLAERFGSIGRGLPGGRLFAGEPSWPPTRLEVVTEEGVPAAPGQLGEIVARGPGITRGYLGDPDETGAFFRDGGLRTGDLGTADADGYITIRGREREFIKVAGVRVSATEIEEALLAHPGVADAAVMAVPDPVTGEAVAAHVVACSGGELRRADILAHCRQRLGGESVPRHVRQWDALPRTPSGKVARAELVLDAR